MGFVLLFKDSFNIFKYTNSSTFYSPVNDMVLVFCAVEMRVVGFKDSEYDQEIPQSKTTDNPMAPRGRATYQLPHTRKTN